MYTATVIQEQFICMIDDINAFVETAQNCAVFLLEYVQWVKNEKYLNNCCIFIHIVL